MFTHEVYYYQAIKKELPTQADFITMSGSEVVLEAWRRWDASCLQKLRGMYAFVIHDTSTGETFIARDPFGIKPLFYLPLSGESIAFASELKTIEMACRAQPMLNHAAVAKLMQQSAQCRAVERLRCFSQAIIFGSTPMRLSANISSGASARSS